MGCFYDGSVQPKHWMIFADDATIVAALESNNQLLCNGFLKWSSWAGLIVRVDKCSVFGMKKSKTESINYQIYVTINREKVRPIKNSGNFTYLGKDFNFNMNCDHVEESLVKTICGYTNRIDTLPSHPLCKIEVCQKYVYSKIKWSLSIYDLSETWVKENINSYLNQLYRIWLQKKKKNFMAPFSGWSSTASRLGPLRAGSLLFTTKFPDIPVTHFTDLGRMRG